MIRAMMDCLLAKCIPCITDCVMGELEKLGGKYKIALRLAKDPRFERVPCSCKGCYADDCLTNMAKQWRCFIVATCDKELRGRIRKIPGVPCMYISGYKYTVEVCIALTWGLSRCSLSIMSANNMLFPCSECRKRLELHRSCGMRAELMAVVFYPISTKRVCKKRSAAASNVRIRLSSVVRSSCRGWWGDCGS